MPATLLVLVVAAAPLMLFRLGGAVGNEVAASVESAGVAEGLVLGPLLAAAVAGAALAVAVPERAALGGLIAAGPPGAVAAVVALVLVPAAVGSVVVVPSLVAVCTGLGRALPGGAGSGVALAAATLAVVPAGAIVAEGGVGLVRRQYRRAVAVAVGTAGWLVVGLALGAPPLGPLAAVPTALRGAGSPLPALAVACGAGIGLGTVWILLVATRADPRSHRLAVGKPHRRRLPAPVAAAVLLARRGDLRLATVGGTVFGLAGSAVAARTDAPPPAPFLLGTTTALLGSLLCPLVVGGVLAEGRWLWRRAPVRNGAIARSFALASTSGAALPVAIVGGAAAVVSGEGAGIVGVVAVLVVVGSAAALLAGAVLPWRDTGAGDQMTTIAAFAAIAIAASLVVGLVAPRFVSLGVPDAAMATAICFVSIVVALAALDRRLAAGAR